MIISKSCGPSKSSKSRTQKLIYSKIVVLGIKKWFNMTVVIILVITLIILNIGRLQLGLVANKMVFSGLPIKIIVYEFFMGRPEPKL